jgi:isopenicillin N synthase-like dioxygenase
VPAIPVIDVHALREPGDGRAVGAVAEQVAGAARNFGFFQVTHHGIPEELIERVWAQTRWFFGLPKDVKRSLGRTKENTRGYYDRELTKQRRDLKEVFDFAHLPYPELPDDHPDNHARVDGHNQWPLTHPAFRNTMLEYLGACEDLGLALLGAFCMGLGGGLPRNALAPHFGRDNTSFIRLNYYPLTDPLDAADAATVTALGDMALHHHTDAGALTILLQDDVGGLQVLHRDEWIDVPPLPGAFVINTGDMMQVWSNDLYQAAMHRVLPRTGRERYSIPCFFNPSYDTDYAPLRAEGDRPKYSAINWGDFRQRRADGDYADFGKEVQIADFRLR